LALDAPYELANLVIEANLAAGDQSAVVLPEPIVVEANKPNAVIDPIESVVAISVDPGAADVAANVKAIPVVHDRSRRRGRLHRHVRSLRGTPQHHGGKHTQSKQEQLSHKSPH
jgi:hypothetical protein